MDAQQFVDVLRFVLVDSTVNETLENLAAPPGRAPAKSLLEMSAWYRSLGAADQAMLRRVVEDAVDATMFGFLCVLDGARAIEDGSVGGEPVLQYVGAHGPVQLNDPAKPPLHELW